jgi:membrane-associated phospholipid phosphatase
VPGGDCDLPVRFPRLRPAELLAALGLAGVGLAYALTPARRGSALDLGGIPYEPNALLLLATLTAYASKLTFVGARKGIATVVLATGGRTVAAGEDLSFSEERQILAAAARLVRDCLPLYVASLLYMATDFVAWRLHGPATADAALIRADEVLFGGQASMWMERFITPARTDLFSLLYFLHVVEVIGVLLILHFMAGRRLFVEAVQGVATMMTIGFALYLAVPGIGPKYTLAASYTRALEGGSITAVNAAVMDALRAHRDVFPSLHVALSGLVLLYAWRASRPLALVLMPFVLGNWVSTIYLRYHYLIDVVAGAALVPAVYFAIRRWMESAEGKAIRDHR